MSAKNKTKKIKAERMTVTSFAPVSKDGRDFDVCAVDITYFVLPTDAESYAKLAQQVDEAIERGINRWLAGTAGPDGCKRLPHEVLRAIGIKPHA